MKSTGKALFVVYKTVERFCTNMRLHDIKDDYFRTWSKDMAWILGHAQADGNVSKKDFRLSYCISAKDIDLLKFIKDKLCPSRDITRSKCFLPITNKSYDMARFYVNSKEMITDLFDLGLKPKKTGKEEFPTDIPDEFIRHFIRGYFDGDGSVGIYRYKGKCDRYNFQITCASSNFLSTIKSNINCCKIRKRDNIYDLCTSSRYEIGRIYDYLYCDGGFCLQRKKRIFEEIKEASLIPKRKTGPKGNKE